MCVEERSSDDDDEFNLRNARAMAARLPNPLDFVYGLNLKKTDGRTIFFSRHGESEYNVQERIGGDPPLTPRGRRYARAFANYMNALGTKGLLVDTSVKVCDVLKKVIYVHRLSSCHIQSG